MTGQPIFCNVPPPRSKGLVRPYFWGGTLGGARLTGHYSWVACQFYSSLFQFGQLETWNSSIS